MPKPDLASLLTQVDAQRLMADVARQTRVVRTPATDGEREAFAAIADALRAAGLTPVCHNLPAYVSMPEKAQLTVGGESLPCTTHSMLPSADIEADLVDVADPARLSPQQATGKLLLMDGLAMVPALRAAQAVNAAGVVFVAGSHHYHEMIVSPVWGSPEPKDLDSFLKLPAVTVCHADGEKLRAHLASSPCRVHLRTEVRTFWTELPVLTADLGPVDQGYLLLTGHIDSWHKGAMDNASGTAAALEIARILAPLQHELRRGIRLVFWSGHSHGRYAGSTAFCDAFFHDLHDNAFLHINADCLGAHGSTLLTQGACMAETWQLGDFALRTVTGQPLEGTRFSRSCDQSFWGTGTPSLFSAVSEQPKPASDDAASRAFALLFGGSKSGGYGWWWHTIADTDDKLDPLFLQRDTQIFLAAVYKAVTDALLPLDIRAGFAELAAHIRAYAAEAGPALDFTPLLAEVARVERLLAALKLDALPPDAANQRILAFEKRLVPLVYVKGSPFAHDPALRQAPLPLLEDVRELAVEADPHRRNALLVLLRRRLNAVRHAVRELAHVIE